MCIRSVLIGLRRPINDNNDNNDSNRNKRGHEVELASIEGSWRELMGVAVVKIHCIHG